MKSYFYSFIRNVACEPIAEVAETSVSYPITKFLHPFLVLNIPKQSKKQC